MACGNDPVSEDPLRPPPSTPDASEPTFDLGEAGVQTLSIKPENPTVEVSGPNTTLKFTAYVSGVAVPASWTLDVGDMGSMATDGTFTASGAFGGTTRVLAHVGSFDATTNITIRLHVKENLGNLDTATQDKLRMTDMTPGAADASFRWLYPYDKTVFPRGLLPPTLQFGESETTKAEAFRVTVTSQNFDYEGFFVGNSPSRVPVSSALWTAVTRSAGGAEPVKVAVSKVAGGKAFGPIKETWTVAQGSLKGNVYYNSYNSLLARNNDPNAPAVGAIMRIKPGNPKPDVFLGGTANGCAVCHTVSANGNVLIAVTHNLMSNPPPGSSPYYGQTWSIGSGDTKTKASEEKTALFNWGGLFPDGSLLMTNGVLTALPAAQNPSAWYPNVPGVGSPQLSTLIDPLTSKPVTVTGWTPQNALMPAFSPDGSKLAFMRHDAPTNGGGHTMATIDFDVKTMTFANQVDVHVDPNSFLGWPTFTPDKHWLVFSTNTRGDYATWNASGNGGWLGGTVEARGHMMITHLGSKTTTRLDAVSGYDPGGGPSLPYGADDSERDYEPTILPQPVGGYMWVVFTSRRKYGNLITEASPYDPGNRKKLWVAALDLDSNEQPHVTAADISHPAFYLEGQEFEAGNSRGFWALDACKPLGNACVPGIESCCNGFCRQQGGDEAGVPTYACKPDKQGCSQDSEACAVSADCCDFAKGAQCLAGKCALPTPR